MTLDELNARAILDGAHAAWSKGDVDAMLRYCDDDVVYWCNAGGPRRKPLTIVGKPVFRDFLEAVTAVTESICVMEYFRLVDGVGRAKIEGCVRHRFSGHALVCSFRQVVTFRDRRILRIDEYHDAAKMVAFWRIVAGEAVDVAAFGDGGADVAREERLDIAR